MRKNNKELYEHYKNIIEDNRDILIRARQITGNPEYQKAQSYFRTLKSRGAIKERPTIENGYKIEVK